MDEPSCEGLRTCGVRIRRLCAEGSAREGLTLQLEPIYRWVLLAEIGLTFPERLSQNYDVSDIGNTILKSCQENILQSAIYWENL
jgi:hypothetical protein